MPGKADFAELKVIAHLLGKRTLTVPDSYFIRLYTAMPDDAGTGGTSPAGNGYTPLEVVNNTTNFIINGDNIIENGVAFTFPPASGGNWGSIVGFGLWSASSGGNAWFINELENPVTINDGQIFKFEAGDLVFTES